jgi:hypothetical protein
MAIVASTVKTNISVVNKDVFDTFLREKGVKNFELFTVPGQRKVFISFTSGAEQFKYSLRSWEEEFIASYPVANIYADYFEDVLFDTADTIIRGIEDEEYR